MSWCGAIVIILAAVVGSEVGVSHTFQRHCRGVGVRSSFVYQSHVLCAMEVSHSHIVVVASSVLFLGCDPLAPDNHMRVLGPAGIPVVPTTVCLDVPGSSCLP